MRVLLVTALVFVAGMFAPPTAHITPPKLPTRYAGPTIILLPGGGWQHADPATMEPWRVDFETHGIHAIVTTYPLKNVPAAIAYVKALADKQPKPVILYGISAGGTIAAALAATGDVNGAVNIAGPTDFTRWITPAGITIMHQIGMKTRAQKVEASPYWRINGKQTPQLIQCGVADPLVTYDQCQRYYDAVGLGNPDMYIQPMINGHSQTSQDRIVARKWITDHWPLRPLHSLQR